MSVVRGKGCVSGVGRGVSVGSGKECNGEGGDGERGR